MARHFRRQHRQKHALPQQWEGTFTDVTAGSGLDTKPPNTLKCAGCLVRLRQRRPSRPGRLELHSVDARKRPSLPRGDVEVYCHPRTYGTVPHRLYHNLGGRQVRRRHGEVRDSASRAEKAWESVSPISTTTAGWTSSSPTIRSRISCFSTRRNGTFKESGLQVGVAYNDSGTAVSAMGADAKDYDNDGFGRHFLQQPDGADLGAVPQSARQIFRYVSPAATRCRN